MKILWIFLGGHHKIGLVLGVISMYLGSFLKVKVQNGDIFGCCKYFKDFLAVLDIPDIFLVNSRCWAQVYV